MKLFDYAYLIHLFRRDDRRDKSILNLNRIGVTADWFYGYDALEFPMYREMHGLTHEGKPNGNAGCTASHRAILTLIAKSQHDRVLVLEDDFLPLYDDIPARLDAIEKTVPEFDLLYLGGHYGSPPISRISPTLIRCDRMLTTSSYIITRQHARRMVPYLTGIGPIDNLFSNFAQDYRHYIVQPRLFAQYLSKSDLCGETRDNVPCMTDTRHEKMV